jgi:hypothetical protein
MMPLEDPHTAEPGVAVICSDGARLGTVKETSGSFFKIDAPLHRDFWLSERLVKARDESGLLLDIPRNAVAEHRLDEPGLEPGDDPFEKIASNAVLTEEEMLEQRAMMERELAAQSRDLPPHEPSVTQMRGPRAYERIPADHTGFGDLAGGYVPNAPVQDRLQYETAGARRGSIAMLIVPAITLAGLSALALFVMVRRRRNHGRERIRDHAKAAARLAEHRVLEAAELAEARAADAARTGGRRLRRMVAAHGASLAGRIQHRLERVA